MSRAHPLVLLLLFLGACAGAPPPGATRAGPPEVTLRVLPPVDLVVRPVSLGFSYRLAAEQALGELAWEGAPVEGPPFVLVPEGSLGGEAWLAVPATAPGFLPAGWRTLALPALEVAVLDARAAPLEAQDPALARQTVRMAGHEPRGPVLLRLDRDGDPVEILVALSGGPLWGP